VASGKIIKHGFSSPVELSIHNTSIFEKTDTGHIYLRVNAEERLARIDIVGIQIKAARNPGVTGHILADIPSAYKPILGASTFGRVTDPDNTDIMNPIPLTASGNNGCIINPGAIGYKVGNILSGYISWFY